MKKLSFLFLAIMSLALFTQCTKDDDSNDPDLNTTGEFQLEITDAPSDDANIKGVFITIVDVKVDGESFEGFSGKTTIDIMAYQNGNTEVLGLGELKTGSYSNISLVLDYDADDENNGPGCYVLTVDDTKESLKTSASSTGELIVSNSFDITADLKTQLVADFDLRKSIKYEDNSQTEFEFTSDTELNAAIRLVNKKESGDIQGSCDDNITGSDKIIVYAYKKGTYNRDTEINGQGNSNIQFKNATTSAEVNASGMYHLAFLESGEYELIYAAYDDDDNDGKFELSGTLQVNSLLNLDLLGIQMAAEASVTVDVLVTGIDPV